MEEQLATLTPNQRFLFDDILYIHPYTTLEQQIKLADFISKDNFVDGGVINPITGNPITDQRQKNFYWYNENYNTLEIILDI